MKNERGLFPGRGNTPVVRIEVVLHMRLILHASCASHAATCLRIAARAATTVGWSVGREG